MVWEASTGVKEQSGVMDILGSFKSHFKENVHVGLLVFQICDIVST